MRVGVVGEELHSAISVHAGKSGASGTVRGSAAGDRCRTVQSLNGQRISSGRQTSLHVGASLAQMNCVGANVSDFQNPVLSQIALHRQIPLLGVRGHKVARNGKSKQELRWHNSGTACSAADIRKLRCVSTREILDHAETRQETGIDDLSTRGGQSVGVGIRGFGATSRRRRIDFEELSQASCRTAASLVSDPLTTGSSPSTREYPAFPDQLSKRTSGESSSS